MSQITSFKHNVGSGCPGIEGGLPPHNPQPRTARGQRRHDQRNAEQKKHAEAAWQRNRTDKPSRYQKALGQKNSFHS